MALAVAKLQEKIEQIPFHDCWEWCGSINPDGYGVQPVGDSSTAAHRAVYEALVGPIPDGLQLDHLCGNRSCVRPSHLEPVTPIENYRRSNAPSRRVQRSGRCLSGHDLSEHGRIETSGKLACRVCKRERMRKYREKNPDYGRV